MGGLFGGGGGGPRPTPPPATPGRSAAEVQAEALALRKRRSAAVGRSDTIYTSGGGVQLTDAATPATKTLLGEA